MGATKKSNIFATPAQTQRWVKCMQAWAKANNKTNLEISAFLGLNRVTWYRLVEGHRKRVRLKIINTTAHQLGLDQKYINGIYDFKNKFSEAKNIFSDFSDTYSECLSSGNAYMAAQIVRKAAMFVFETLAPKGINIKLEIINNKNSFDAANVFCSADDKVFFRINVYGGPRCVMFTMSKKTGAVEVPVMEGDLDVHALSAIRMQLYAKKQIAIKSKLMIAKFEDNAKKFAL